MEIIYEMTLTLPGKGNPLRETESQLIVAQNNGIKTNSIKAKLDSILNWTREELRNM